VRCLSCKYDLSSLTEHRCPECGRAFDPDDPSTFSSDSARAQRRKAIKTSAALIGVVFVVLLVIDWNLVELPFKGLLDRALTNAVIAAVQTLEVSGATAVVVFSLLLLRRLSQCFQRARDTT
jgi:rRNA maturation protein Nop10